MLMHTIQCHCYFLTNLYSCKLQISAPIASVRHLYATVLRFSTQQIKSEDHLTMAVNLLKNEKNLQTLNTALDTLARIFVSAMANPINVIVWGNMQVVEQTPDIPIRNTLIVILSHMSIFILWRILILWSSFARYYYCSMQMWFGRTSLKEKQSPIWET